MLLHIGNDVMVALSDIICILDIGTCEKSKSNEMLFNASAEKTIQETKPEANSKSLIVVQSDEKTILFYSPIASVTLLKRSKHLLDDYTLA